MYKKVPRVKRNKDGSYPMRPQDMVNAAKKVEPIIYRMGENGLFQVVGEYKDYYTGHWFYGPYSQAVPKAKLRKLTDAEFEKWSNTKMNISGIPVPLNITRD